MGLYMRKSHEVRTWSGLSQSLLKSKFRGTWAPLDKDSTLKKKKKKIILIGTVDGPHKLQHSKSKMKATLGKYNNPVI